MTHGQPATVLRDSSRADQVPKRTVLRHFLDEGGSWVRCFLSALTPARLAWVGVGVVALCGLTYVAFRSPGVRLVDAGGTVRVLEDGRLRLPAGVEVADAWQRRLAPLLAGTAPTVDAHPAARLRGLRTDLVRLGPSERPAPLPLAPVGVLIRPGPVTFRWHGVEGATNYTLLVSDGEGRVVVERDTGVATNIVLSSPTVSFRADDEYSWQVAALVNDEVHGCAPVRFAVLDAAGLAELDAVEAGAGKSALVMGAVLLHFGLLDEADQRVAELRRLNPGHPLVTKLEQALAHARRTLPPP